MILHDPSAEPPEGLLEPTPREVFWGRVVLVILAASVLGVAAEWIFAESEDKPERPYFYCEDFLAEEECDATARARRAGVLYE